MSEFTSMRASVTGSAVPTPAFSYGAEHKITEQTNENTEAGTEGGGNTVTFGGVETFSKTNSTAGSTTDALTEGIGFVMFGISSSDNFKSFQFIKSKISYVRHISF